MFLKPISILVAALLTNCATNCGCSPEEQDRAPKTIPALIPTGVKNMDGLEYEKVVYGRSGDSPVLLLHAMTGLSFSTLQLGEIISSWGYEVHIPDLFVGPRAVGFEISARRGMTYVKSSPEWNGDEKFTVLPQDGIISHVSLMASRIHSESNQPVIVIGNCLTGIIPLALMDQPFVSTGVICQPATPVAGFKEIFLRRRTHSYETALGLEPGVAQRSFDAMKRSPSKKLIGFHYEHDPVAPTARFDTIHEQMENAGIASQFETNILHSKRMKPRSWWTSNEITSERQGLISPHSTLVNAIPDEDREWFLAKLKEGLSQSNQR